MNQVPTRVPSTRAPASAGALAISLVASLVLLLHATLGAFGLVAWFRGAHVVSWRVLVAAAGTVLALAASALLWLAPSRRAAAVGLAILLGSLARLGAPATWTELSYGFVAVTAACCLPLVRACVSLD